MCLLMVTNGASTSTEVASNPLMPLRLETLLVSSGLAHLLVLRISSLAGVSSATSSNTPYGLVKAFNTLGEGHQKQKAHGFSHMFLVRICISITTSKYS